ncbi:MAG: PTS galactitol transporter subunit IIB [Actinomycetota bacterium]|nr:MAG: PTS galactitol transporter subunit IIB [Actinomycetota bacterium]
MDKKANRKIKILCSCGTGVATCSFISTELKKFLAGHGIDAEIIECSVKEVYDCYKDVDLIISTSQLPPKIDRPRISGVPFLTGNNLDQTKEEILRLFKK